MQRTINSILPGRFILSQGNLADYRALERFHYRPKRPATIATVWIIRYIPDDDSPPRTVAAAVLSYPTLACAARDHALHLSRLSPAAKARFINRHIRTISRVIVHPTFRSLGLAVALVRHVLRKSPTRFTEALAMMGRVHPFFRNAGMREFASAEAKPSYYLFDRRVLMAPPLREDCRRAWPAGACPPRHRPHASA